MERDFGIGDVIGATGALLSDTWRDTLLYVLGIGGLTAAGHWFGLSEQSEFSFGFGFMINANAGLTSALFELAAAIASVVAGYWLLTRMLVARGRFRDGDGRFWHYLGMSILSGIAMVVGFLLLIVPGTILMVRWSAASGFVIDGREGVTDSLAASWRATKGHSWAIFFAGLIIAVSLIVAGGLFGLTTFWLGETAVGMVSAFLEAFAGAVFLAVGIGIYCLVHDGSEELEEVFA
jgi:hypothetical protein